VGIAQLARAFAQVARQVSVKASRVLAVRGLGHGLLRHHAVFLHQRAEHIPLPAIAHRVGKQEGHHAPVERLVERREDVLQEPVALLELVPIQRVSLRQLEFLHAVFLHDARAHRVQAREHPAPAGTLLVGTRTLLHLDVEGGGVERSCLGHFRHAAHALARHGVLRHDVRAIGAKRRIAALDILEGDRLHLVHVSVPFHRTKQPASRCANTCCARLRRIRAGRVFRNAFHRRGRPSRRTGRTPDAGRSRWP